MGVKRVKKITAYFKKFPAYNSMVHILIGVGLGILITYPLVGGHPVRWGLVLVAIGLVGHLYPALPKK